MGRYDMTDGALQVGEDTNLEGLRMEQIDLFDAPAPPERKRQEEAAPDDGLDEMLATSARKTVGFPVSMRHPSRPPIVGIGAHRRLLAPSW